MNFDTIKEMIVLYLPTVIMVLSTFSNYASILRTLRGVSVKRELNEFNREMNAKMLEFDDKLAVKLGTITEHNLELEKLQETLDKMTVMVKEYAKENAELKETVNKLEEKVELLHHEEHGG